MECPNMLVESRGNHVMKEDQILASTQEIAGDVKYPNDAEEFKMKSNFVSGQLNRVLSIKESELVTTTSVDGSILQSMHKSPLAPSIVPGVATPTTDEAKTPIGAEVFIMKTVLVVIVVLHCSFNNALHVLNEDYEDKEKKEKEQVEEEVEEASGGEEERTVPAQPRALEQSTNRQANLVPLGQEAEPKCDDLLESAYLSTPDNHSSPICTIAPLTMGTRDPSHTASTSAIEDDSSGLSFQLATLDQSGRLNSHLATTQVASDKGNENHDLRSPQPNSSIKRPMPGTSGNDLNTPCPIIKLPSNLCFSSLSSSEYKKTFISRWTYFSLLFQYVKLPDENTTEGSLHRATVLRCRQQYRFPIHTKELDTPTWIFILFCLYNPGMAMISPIEDIIAFENSQPLSVNCTGGTNGVPWLKVNGQDPNSVQIPGLYFDPGDQVQYLTIPAAASANNTNVTCEVVDFYGRIVELTALKIYTQGPLGPPINFSVATAENLTFTLSWVAPFSFHVNKDPPDIYGYVLCTNISKYGCWISTNDLNCTFPNTCTYTLNAGISGEKLVTAITFSLCAINGAGSGQYATIIVDLKAAEHLPTLSSAASNGTISASYSTISVSSGTASASYGIITAFLIVLLL